MIAVLHMRIGGMHCSLCEASVRRAVQRLPGVLEVHASIAHGEALIRYDPERVKPEDFYQTLEALGFSIRPPDEVAAIAQEEAELQSAWQKVWWASLALGIGSGLMGLRFLYGPHPLLMAGMAALAFSMALGPARFILRNGLQALRRRILNQDVLVLAAAFAGLVGGGLGVLDPAFPSGAFLGAAVFVLAFHIIGGYFSIRVHVQASQAVRRLLQLQPEQAARLRPDGSEEVVPAAWLQPGDLIRVRPGERIPADGIVRAGASAVDESLLTGEPIPRDRLPGDPVIAGSINLSGALIVEVTRVGEETFLRQVARLVAEARAMKPGILRLVDRVLLVYVPAVFLAALTGFLLWTAGLMLMGGRPDLIRALFALLTVLVMGYPCALGMATPLAMIRTSGVAAARGILMRSPEAFHVFKDVKAILLDKTGTLTLGHPTLIACIPLDGDEQEILRVAAGAELPSEHPLARAIVAAARDRGIHPPEPEAFTAQPGQGVIARLEGQEVLVGRRSFLEERGLELTAALPVLAAQEALGRTTVLVAVDRKVGGVLAFGDPLKPDAAEAIATLRRLDLEPMLISGDNPGAVRAVAKALGILQAWAGLLPHEKMEIIRRLQRQGLRVAFVGDGINDAPALMQADLGIAIGAGADIALEAADIVIAGERLQALAEAFQLSRASYRLTATNVGLALIWNGLGMLAALSGRVDPVWAMLAMAISVSAVLFRSISSRLLEPTS